MENGVSKVEEVKLKVGKDDVLGDMANGGGSGSDDAGDESVSEMVNVEVVDGRKDLSDENGDGLGDSLLLDGSVDIAEKFKGAAEASSELETVKAKADMNLAEVIDGESSTIENATRDQSMVDCDEHEGEVSIVEELNGEINVSDNTFSDQLIVLKANEAVNDDVGGESTSSNQSSGLEVNEASNDDNSEEKVVKLAHALDGESSSANTTMDQVSELETDVSVVGGKGKAEVVGLADEHVINLVQTSGKESISDSADRGQACELDSNMSVVGGNDEVELVRLSDEQVLNLVQGTDRESTFDNAARDHSGELETDVSVVGGKLKAEVVAVTDDHNAYTYATKDEPHLLENNVVIENGVNGDGEVSNVDTLDDVHDVNEKPASVTLGHSENGAPKSVALDEIVLQEDGLNVDSASHITQPDGEIGGDENIDVNEKHNLGAECKVGDSKNRVEEFETSISKSVNVQSESTLEQIQEGEHKSFDSSSAHQDAENLEQVIDSAIDVPNNHVESLNSENGIHVSMEERTENPKVEKKELNEVKQDIPLKKEPESRQVIGVSLSAQKPAIPTSVANPKQDKKPNQTPIPNPKPITAPTPAPSPSPSPSPSPAPSRPAGLGSGAPLLEPAHRVVAPQANGNGPPLQNQVIDEPTNGEAEENDDTREKLQMIRVKFLRLARRLGQTPHNVVVAQVLYRLGLAEQLRGRNGGRVAAFSFERASAMAEQLEAAGQEPLEFSCTIMVLGKTGVGKSATINSIFDDTKFGTDAFQVGTKKVQDVVGTVQGIKVRVIDTPGLLPSWTDQRKNEKILHSVKRFIQKSPPDIVLYLDRLDMQSRDSGDMPLLRTITDIFGQSIWFNAIVVLTHAASAPPEGPNGTATSYDMFVTQRSHVVQQSIRQAAGDMRLMNPVSLVENHSACRTNRAGQRVLPNGQVWKPHLLLLSFASKILVEANMLLKLQDSPPGKPFAARTRAPSLPFILSNLLQSRPQLKLPQEQFGDDDDDGDDDDMDESSDEESSEYDELPPFKRLTNSQLSKLSKAQKKSYYDELEYREKLFMKKQLKEEKKRRKLMKKMAEAAKNFPTDLVDNSVEEDSNSAASVPVAVQDMNLPASFDADNPTHRYRALDSANQWLIRPVLDPHGWDHDVGYEGINVEHILALKEKIPISFSGQVTKDKKDANLQMEVSSAMKHGKSKSTTLAFDMQTVGKEMSYTLRSDTRFINYRKNKASAGLSATYMGDTLTGGVKFEDNLVINKRGQLVVAGGAVIGRGDVAYGGSLEATLRDKDYPLGRFLSTIGLSVMDWHGDLALGWNAQSQIPIGRFTNLIGRVNLNNKGSGQVSMRLNSSEQLQIALVALVPLVSKLLGYYQDRDTTY
uniref:translocase of chloroplast 120, chloroplastic n=1 Tax=Erigeron canadensis TaxID=72917 RepID=UPI001CB9AF2F|nr:translocase of chloroplast 120, chloroplastic [Erigeron canadensis]